MIHPYTSNELYHFVGFSHPTDDEANYITLLKILDTGCVSYGPDFPLFPSFRMSFNWDTNHVLAGGLIVPEVTCYADIPFSALQIHMSKYGRLGIAFRREYLVRRGARPVIYIPLQPSDNLSGYGTIFTTLMVTHWMETWKGFEEQAVAPIRRSVWKETLGSKPETQEDAILAVNNLLSSDFFAFLKVFNSDLEQNDPENYYMEREWRIANPVPFTLSDVASVIIPKHFETRFLDAYPTYSEKVTHAPD